MSTFSGWWNAFNKNPKILSHYWICGVETVLVDEAVDLIRAHYPVSEWNYQVFNVGVDSEESIWQALFSNSIDSMDSLVIVLRAETLKNKDHIEKLINSKLSNKVVIFVSSEPRVEKVKVSYDSGETKSFPPTYLETFEKRGKVIECIPFTQATAKTAVAWIKTKVEAKDGALIHLLNASGGDLLIIRDVLKKLQWLQEPATIRNVNYFLKGHSELEFSEALMTLNKEAAVRSLHTIDSDNVLQLIGHLDAQIDLAGRIHDMMSERRTIPEIMKAVGSQGFLVPQLSKVAKHYSRDRRLQIRVLLAETDRRLRRGLNRGVLESLIVLW